MDDRVSVSISDGVADVRLVRADKMNALDAAMFDALVGASDRLAREKGRATELEAWLFDNQPTLTPSIVRQAARDVGKVADFDARYAATVELVKGDISDADDVLRAARGAEAAIHCAALLGGASQDLEDFKAVNTVGTTNVAPMVVTDVPASTRKPAVNLSFTTGTAGRRTG